MENGAIDRMPNEMKKRPMIAEALPTLVGIGPLPSVKSARPRIAAVEIPQEKPAPKSFDEIEIDKVSVRLTPATTPREPHTAKANSYAPQQMEDDLGRADSNFDDDIDAEFGGGFDIGEVDPAEFGLNFEPSDMAPEGSNPKYKHDHLVTTLASELDDAVAKVPEGVRKFIENDLRARFIGVGAL